MRSGCRKPVEMKICIFINHLNRMNNTEFPLLLPFGVGSLLGADKMNEIIKYAIPNSWNRKLQEQGKDPLLMGLFTFLQALEDI